MAELTINVELSSAVVRPGHTLVAGCPAVLTKERAEQIKAHLQERLPGVDVVLIGGVSQLLVYEPDDIRSAQE